MNAAGRTQLLFPTSISAEYDILAFEKADIEELKEQFRSLAPTRVRPAYKERGGIETTLWLVVTWVGLSYASGVVQQIAAKHFDAIMARLHNFYSRRAKPGETCAGQLVALRLSFDDVDIEVNLPGETRADFLNPLLRTVREHLDLEPLRDETITRIRIPFIWDADERHWRQSFEWSDAEFRSRFWGVATNSMPQTTIIYDSDNRAVTRPEFDEVEED